VLSENLKHYREKARYSKLKLARKTGLSARCIEFIEYKKVKNPRLETLKKLAKALNVSVEELIE